jgi:uncharacterized protein involved in exopolysaccharide biosynthesis
MRIRNEIASRSRLVPMELTQYIRLFSKWLWLILIAAFVASGITYIIKTSRPSVYEASTTISIGRFIE